MSVRSEAVQPAAVPAFAKGQLWKLKHAYVYVVDLGKRVIRFKMMQSPEARFERTLTSEVETLWTYLQQRHARLVSA